MSPPIAAGVRRLVVGMARENPTWSYPRIHGEPGGVSDTIGASTVWQLLEHAGIDAAPPRMSMTWSELLRSQAAALPALLHRRTTREVTFGGITTSPTAALTVRAARNLFLGHSEKLADAKALLRDRGSQFTAASDEVFHTEGPKVLTTPVRTPAANSIAERWIGTYAENSSTAPSSGAAVNCTGSWSTTSTATTGTDRTDRFSNIRRHRRPPPHEGRARRRRT